MTERPKDSIELGALPEAKDPIVAELWETLLGETGCDIGIVDQDGRFLFVSPRLSYWRPENARTGLTVQELLPSEAANERMELFRRVASTGRPIVLHSVWRGVRTRTTLRRLPNLHGGPVRILVTCRGTVPSDRDRSETNEIEHVYAKFVDNGRLAVLTPRELEILRLVAQGLTTASIAKKLFRSRKTIEAHRLALGNKLGVRNRVELARIAMEAGLLNEESPLDALLNDDEDSENEEGNEPRDDAGPSGFGQSGGGERSPRRPRKIAMPEEA
ncbi:MAG: PAS domain-containing protein [Phycisphaerales bacterium]|nr:PAS domain-containing protein [Phycisphaerales bacterium]